ncbi:YaaL family protein [Paenibacillus sp. FJAT-26967]|uniref:YaaL family protein n=1 Tax=Paenibacillus sp. FJAT-26967 TaxID=1729690 RepID=UPI0008388550|nr:YaaL family protein [Paenibacillus sp. FJAT-26967]
MSELKISAQLFQRKGRTEEEDKQDLLKEIRKAHLQWVSAQHHFEYALEQDEIDYAIFAMEAAEKRYEMLLRQAKTLKIVTTYHHVGKEVR